VTQVLEGVRQGFVGDVSWADTWPAILALAGLLALVGMLALRRLQRAAD
jgi:ABC-type polysaccharide/polyol phosphate export permease